MLEVQSVCTRPNPRSRVCDRVCKAFRYYCTASSRRHQLVAPSTYCDICFCSSSPKNRASHARLSTLMSFVTNVQQGEADTTLVALRLKKLHLPSLDSQISSSSFETFTTDAQAAPSPSIDGKLKPNKSVSWLLPLTKSNLLAFDYEQQATCDQRPGEGGTTTQPVCPYVLFCATNVDGLMSVIQASPQADPSQIMKTWLTSGDDWLHFWVGRHCEAEN